MSQIENNPNSIEIAGILTEPVGRGKYRQADILMAIAAPDPNFPDDPNSFLYEGISDSKLLEKVFTDKIEDGTFRKTTCENNARSGFHRLLDVIESPNSRKQKDTLERAKNAWQTMREINPRFDSLSNQELIAIFRKRTIKPTTTKPPKKLHKSPFPPSLIPTMTPVEVYRAQQETPEGEFNFDLFMDNLRQAENERQTQAPFRFPGSNLYEKDEG